MAMYTQPPLITGDLFASAERFAAEHEPRLACLAGRDREDALKETWDGVARLGWTGVLISPELGGSGGDVTDLAAIIQGIGRRGLPVPLTYCGTVSLLLGDRAASTALAASLLSAVANGSARICSLIDAPFLDCTRDARVVVVSGCREMESVPGATHYLIACSHQRAEVLLLSVPASFDGVLTETFDRPDGGVGARVTFSEVKVSSADILAAGAIASAGIETATALGELMTSVEAESSIAALLEELVEYLSLRVQFGVPLAENQVLRHKTVDIYLANQALGALVSKSLRMWTAHGSESRRTIMLASTHLRHVAREIAKAGIQLYGGMGLTEELLAARLCKRLLMMEFKLPREHGESNDS
jgi:alkylation response protein AidB-like acyl-CoA dehydrogenase